MAHRTNDPIFIIGTERSGSNLLRLVLNAHSRVAIPHPPHILKYFAALEPGYGDLTDDAQLQQLIDDVLRLLAVHIHPWPITVDGARVLREATPRSLFGVFAAIYEQFRESTGKPRWGCKSTFMIHHVPTILARYPDAGLVWLVRDPRDVAVSSQRSVFNPFHPYLTARLWRDQQQEGLALERAHPERVHRLRYEDLLADPEAAVRGMCEALGEDFEEGMLRFHETDAARHIAGLSESWKNSSSPFMRSNSGAWKTRLSLQEQRWVEGLAGPVMMQLGYALEHPGEPFVAPGLPRLLRFRAQALVHRLRIEARSLKKDDNHWRRWGRRGLMTTLNARRGP